MIEISQVTMFKKYKIKGMYIDDSARLMIAFYALLLFTLFGYMGINCAYKYANPHYETITVKDKTIGLGKNNSYLIYADKQVYEIKDLLWIGFFESSDVYNAMEIGHTYKCYVYGRRVPLFSRYKNITEVEEVK